MALSIGYHRAKIMTTAVAVRNDSRWIELEVFTEDGEQVLVKQFLTQRALPWTQQKLERLGFKDTLASIAGNRSMLTGLVVDLRVKEGKSPRNDGGFWPEYELYLPKAKGTSSPAQELPEGEMPTEGRLTESQLAALENEVGGFDWGVK
jgi:hypothetical protein